MHRRNRTQAYQKPGKSLFNAVPHQDESKRVNHEKRGRPLTSGGNGKKGENDFEKGEQEDGAKKGTQQTKKRVKKDTRMDLQKGQKKKAGFDSSFLQPGTDKQKEEKGNRDTCRNQSVREENFSRGGLI